MDVQRFALTRRGLIRWQYRTIEQAPSRFSPEYAAWAARADAWGDR